MVASVVDERVGLCEVLVGLSLVAVAESEAGGSEMVVGEVESHVRAARDTVGFIKITRRATGEKGEGEIVKRARTAEEVDCLVQVVGGFRRAGGMCASE